MEKYASILEKTVLFEGLDAPEITAICHALGCRGTHYARGSVIVKRGERVESAGIVLSGAVQAERNGVDGTLHIVARHSAGAIFGDVLTVSLREKSPVDILAVEDTEVLLVPLAGIMDDLTAEHRRALVKVRRNLLRELAEKYWVLHRQAEILRAPTLRAKLARRLLEERRLCGGDAFTLSGTREALAAELGVNRSALSRELGNMRRERLLATDRGSFTLLDVAALHRIAEQG